ncbi:MAG: hypothetical protein ACE5HT_11920 [Gemmatimonadales bacterium]
MSLLAPSKEKIERRIQVYFLANGQMFSYLDTSVPHNYTVYFNSSGRGIVVHGKRMAAADREAIRTSEVFGKPDDIIQAVQEICGV